MNATELEEVSQQFLKQTDVALRGLFDAARARDELQFAFSLAPEFRGAQDEPLAWSTAADTLRAFEQYLPFLNESADSPLKMRIALAFYCHLSEASGYYEIPKNMLRVAGGERCVMRPFKHLVRAQVQMGAMIAPSASRVLRDLAEHAACLNFLHLAEVIREAFDPDLRNGYAHADYVIWHDGIRLTKRNGGTPRIVSWPEFSVLFNRGVNFFRILHQITREYTQAYDPPKTIRASFGSGAPKHDCVIAYDANTRSLRITGTASVA